MSQNSKTIGELGSVPTLNNTALIEIEQDVESFKTTIQDILDLVSLTKADVGLGNVDNTSDVNKPVSTATQTALDLKQNSLGFTAEDVSNKATNLTSPGNIQYPTTQAVAIALLEKQPLNSDLTAIVNLIPSDNDIIQRKSNVWVNRTASQYKTDLALVKSDVGLGNVDNTSDANKPVSTDTQTALNLKEDSLGFVPENLTNKGANSGYAGLDSSTKLLLANFPSGSALQVLRRNSANDGLEFFTPVTGLGVIKTTTAIFYSHPIGTTERDITGLVFANLSASDIDATLELVNVTQITQFRVLEKTDGTNYEQIQKVTYPTDNDDPTDTVIKISIIGHGRDVKVTMKSIVAESSILTILGGKATYTYPST